MIGYACKWVSQLDDVKLREAEERAYNGMGTNATWCARQSKDAAREKLLTCAHANITGMLKFVKHAAGLPVHGRMIRFGSGIIPLYTHADWRDFWTSNEIQSQLREWFAPVGDAVHAYGIRSSWHPDHFVAIASEREDVRVRSLQEIEYHAHMIELMGLTHAPLESKINIHINGRLGPSQFLTEFDKLSELARDNLSVENSDVGSYGIHECLSMDRIPVVLDLHHHWIMTGEHLTPDNEIWNRVRRTWRHAGKPTIHFSISKEEHVPSSDDMPVLADLKASGKTTTDLRAHSDRYHHAALCEYIKQWVPHAHIMLECKHKNLAQAELMQKIF